MVPNPRHNKKWEITTEKYRELYLMVKANPSAAPNHKTKQGRILPFCLGFHVRGECKRGKECNLSHEDPRDVDKATEFANFIKPFQAE